MSQSRPMRRIATGLAFLLPNILGFLAFTLFPLVYSMVLAFSNWDLRLHNMFRDVPIHFVGLDNVIRLFAHPDFWRFLGNTLFFMMGIPFGMAGSLLAAILLLWHLFMLFRRKPEAHPAGTNSGGSALMVGLGLLTLQFVFIGLGEAAYHLPAIPT